MASGCIALHRKAVAGDGGCFVNPVRVEIERTGATILPSGEAIRVHSHVGPDSVLVIRLAVEVAKPKPACEGRLEYEVNKAQLVSLRRVGDDLRSSDRFVPF